MVELSKDIRKFIEEIKSSPLEISLEKVISKLEDFESDAIYLEDENEIYEKRLDELDYNHRLF